MDLDILLESPHPYWFAGTATALTTFFGSGPVASMFYDPKESPRELETLANMLLMGGTLVTLSIAGAGISFGTSAYR